MSFLFNAAPVDTCRCLARIWQKKDTSKPVFEQCSRGRTFGDFCGGHKSEKQRSQGVWDPPAHAALPRFKLEEEMREASRRDLAVSPEGAVAQDRTTQAQTQGRGTGKGRGRRGRGMAASPPLAAESVACGSERSIRSSAAATAAAEMPPETQVEGRGKGRG